MLHPSLATAVNERNMINAYHQEDELIEEIQRVISDGTLIDKHIDILSLNNQSGISLRKVIAMNITVLKMIELK